MRPFAPEPFRSAGRLGSTAGWEETHIERFAAISNKQEQDQISDSAASCSHSQRGDRGFSERRSRGNSNRVSKSDHATNARVGNEHLRWRLLCCVRRWPCLFMQLQLRSAVPHSQLPHSLAAAVVG